MFPMGADKHEPNLTVDKCCNFRKKTSMLQSRLTILSLTNNLYPKKTNPLGLSKQILKLSPLSETYVMLTAQSRPRLPRFKIGSNSVPESGTDEQFHRLCWNWIWHSSTASLAPLATLAIRVGCLRQISRCFVLSWGVVKHRRAAFFAGSVDSVVCVPNVLEKAQEKKSVELRDIS